MKKIKINSIFIGNINKIKSTNFHIVHSMSSLGIGAAIGHSEIEVERYKEDAMLIKVADCGYVDVDSIRSIFDQLRINRCLNENGGFTLGDIVLADVPTPFAREDTLFVERGSLRPSQFIDQEEISFRQLKRIRRRHK